MASTFYNINGRKIRVQPHEYWAGFIAIDDNSYDPVEDGDKRCGEGETRFVAITDLLEQYDEEMSEEDALQFEDSSAWKAANGQFGVGA